MRTGRAIVGILTLVVLGITPTAIAAGFSAPRWISAEYSPDRGGVALRWSPVEGAPTYRVLRAEGEGSAPEKLATVPGPEYLDKSAERGKGYRYAVQAVAAVGQEPGPASEERRVEIPPAVGKTLPAPAWLPMQPMLGGNQVIAMWLPVPGAVKYRLFMNGNKLAESPANQWQGPAPAQAGAYKYQVAAVDAAGLESPRSAPGVITIVALEAPGKPIFRPDELDGSVQLRWSKPTGAVVYNVYKAENKNGPWNLVSSTQEEIFKDTGLQYDKSNFYALSAKDVSGKESPLSEPVEVRLRKPKMSMSSSHGPVPASPPAYYAPSAVPSPSVRREMMAKSASGGYADPGGAPGKPTWAGFGESFDEVWVISRPETAYAPPPDDDTPGCGELRAVLPGKKPIPLPLKHTEVKAKVSGYIASVTVTQQYQNPYAEKIEAVYVFPLPENAAVSDFVMQVGDRRIRGIIRDRKEAEEIYREARAQGYAAALLTQERPNIFTQKVANIEPGKRIDVDISYFNTLAYEDGAYSFVFPMVVGPRYNPAGVSNGVGAVARGARGISGQSTEVPYLRPGERSGHDIGITLDLEAGVAIEEIESPSHAIRVEKRGKTGALVRLSPADTLPNKDLVVRFRVGGKTLKSAMLVERGDQKGKGGGFFTLMLQPPGNLADAKRGGMEMVFLLDVSGSMSGFPIEKSKAATRRALQNLDSGDTFQIVTFANGTGFFAPSPVAATPGNIEAGLEFLERLQGGGGTEMLRGISAALDFPHDPRRLRVVTFMTDGFIGNEAQVLAAVAEKLGPSRIFAFGVGTSANRYLIEGLARLGKGAVAYLLKNDSDTRPVDLFFERIAHPALTDIEIDWGGMQVSDLYPKRIPDLFVGRPVVLTGRFAGRGDATITVRGRAAGEPVTLKVAADLEEEARKDGGISRIWARARIADLSDAMLKPENSGHAGDLAGDIRKTALNFGLVSDYTAFVAVDTSRVTEGDHGVTVSVPVPVPEGVRYETTVQER